MRTEGNVHQEGRIGHGLAFRFSFYRYVNKLEERH
jgi:hypothetical protein